MGELSLRSDGLRTKAAAAGPPHDHANRPACGPPFASGETMAKPATLRRLVTARNLRALAIELVLLAAIAGGLIAYHRELYSRVLGPFKVTVDDIAAIPSLDSELRRYFTLEEGKLVPLPFYDTIVRTRRGRETGRSNVYYYAVPGKRLVLLRSPERTPSLPVVGTLEPVSGALEQRFWSFYPQLKSSTALAPLLFETEDPVTSWASLYTGAALVAPAVALGFLFFTLWRLANFRRSRAVASLARFRAPVDQVVAGIDAELARDDSQDRHAQHPADSLLARAREAVPARAHAFGRARLGTCLDHKAIHVLVHSCRLHEPPETRRPQRALANDPGPRTGDHQRDHRHRATRALGVCRPLGGDGASPTGRTAPPWSRPSISAASRRSAARHRRRPAEHGLVAGPTQARRLCPGTGRMETGGLCQEPICWRFARTKSLACEPHVERAAHAWQSIEVLCVSQASHGSRDRRRPIGCAQGCSTISPAAGCFAPATLVS